MGPFTPQELRNYTRASQSSQTPLQGGLDGTEELIALAKSTLEKIKWDEVFVQAASGKTTAIIQELTITENGKNLWNVDQQQKYIQVLQFFTNKLGYTLGYINELIFDQSNSFSIPKKYKMSFYIDWSQSD